MLGQGGSPGTIATQMMTAHWQQQLLKCEVSISFPVITTIWCYHSAPSVRSLVWRPVFEIG